MKRWRDFVALMMGDLMKGNLIDKFDERFWTGDLMMGDLMVGDLMMGDLMMSDLMMGDLMMDNLMDDLMDDLMDNLMDDLVDCMTYIITVCSFNRLGRNRNDCRRGWKYLV